MNEDIFENLVVRFLDGKATPHEKEILSTWLRREPAAKETFYFLLAKREKENPQYLPDVQSKLVAYQAFMEGGSRPDRRQRPLLHENSRSLQFRLWLAASFVLLISACLYSAKDQLLYDHYHSGSGSIRVISLQDGTKITLNANSTVRVLRGLFSGDDREVWIDGEGFFEVQRNPDRARFVVHTTNFDVVVLGTKFNVNNRRGKSEVVLAEGKIELVKNEHPPLVMTPGDKVRVSPGDETFEQSVLQDHRYEAWRNSMLVFENTPLSEVTQIILDHYSVKLVINDSTLANRLFTGTLPNNDLDVILLALSTAYNVDVDRKGSDIVLKPRALKQPQL